MMMEMTGACLMPASATPPLRPSYGGTEPPFEAESESVSNETLAQTLDLAYRSAPSLQAERYRLRAADDDYGRALAEVRPSTTMDVSSSYTRQVLGRSSRSSLFGSSPIINDNGIEAKVTAVQPLYTGGRAAAARDAGLAGVAVARAQLRQVEGDLLLRVITSYADIRRDQSILRLREANLRQLHATLGEVKARREAGELTRTDIAQAETQLAIAEAQYSLTQQQMEQDRATFAALVGHAPGPLAPLPPLPPLPEGRSAAAEEARVRNPEVEQAVATERQSRANVAAVGAQGRPSVTIQGSAALQGKVSPYRFYDQNRLFEGRATLSIPLTSGGRIASEVAGARDRNVADLYGIDDAYLHVQSAIDQNWSAIEAARRNIRISEGSLGSARVLDDGTFQEYRAGLRTTFDVLFAHAALRDAEIGRTNAYYDLYVAAAGLLRRMGTLDIRMLSPVTPAYDPDGHFRAAQRRDSLPWDGLLRSVDRILTTAPRRPMALVP